MLELTGHWKQSFMRIGRIGCWIQEMHFWQNSPQERWLLCGWWSHTISFQWSLSIILGGMVLILGLIKINLINYFSFIIILTIFIWWIVLLLFQKYHYCSYSYCIIFNLYLTTFMLFDASSIMSPWLHCCFVQGQLWCFIVLCSTHHCLQFFYVLLF